MKRKIRIASVAVGAVATFLLTGCGKQAWEYSFVSSSAGTHGYSSDAQLQRLYANEDKRHRKGMEGMGLDNWELVSVSPEITDGKMTGYLYAFKRPVVLSGEELERRKNLLPQ